MGKFVWSDYLTGRLLGATSRGIASGATRIGGANLGKAVTKIGALGTVAASGMGIAESYGVMTYEQTYQQMMENLNTKRDAAADTYVKEYMQTPEAQQQINNVIDSKYCPSPPNPRPNGAGEPRRLLRNRRPPANAPHSRVFAPPALRAGGGDTSKQPTNKYYKVNLQQQ